MSEMFQNPPENQPETFKTQSNDAPKHEHVAVLVNGGFVSLALLEYCFKTFQSVLPIYVQSGFRWEETELFWLKKYIRQRKVIKVEDLEIIQMPLRDTFQFHWSFTGVKAPGANDSFSNIQLPGREFLMLCKAAVYSAAFDASALAIGYLKNHLQAMPSPQWLHEVQELASQSGNKHVTFLTPFADKTRDEILFESQNIRADFSYSCLTPRGHQHCGDCFKCHERKTAYLKTGLADKTHYYKSIVPAAV